MIGATAMLRREGDLVWKRARPGFEDAIAREGEALERLDDPRIVRLLGRDGDAIALEYLPGADLRNALLDTRGLLRAAGDVARALAAVHAAGLVHGDVSPGNVIVRPDGRAVLIDFGSARAVGRPADVALGKRAYLAPEQLRAGAPVDGRSDLFALGIVLRERLGPTPLARWLAAPDPRDRPRAADRVAACIDLALA